MADDCDDHLCVRHGTCRFPDRAARALCDGPRWIFLLFCKTSSAEVSQPQRSSVVAVVRRHPARGKWNISTTLFVRDVRDLDILRVYRRCSDSAAPQGVVTGTTFSRVGLSMDATDL